MLLEMQCLDTLVELAASTDKMTSKLAASAPLKRHCPPGVSGWRHVCHATAGLVRDAYNAEEVFHDEPGIEDNKMFEAMIHKATATKYAALTLLGYTRNEATPNFSKLRRKLRKLKKDWTFCPPNFV